MPRKSTALLLSWLLVFALAGGCARAPEEEPAEPAPSPAEGVAPSPAAAGAPRFAGTIDASGYHPPDGASVIWRRPNMQSTKTTAQNA